MRKLYRSKEYKQIAGVCGGLGEYFDIDPIIFRMLFIGLLFGGGSGLMIYILMWIFVPAKH
jgi:phage shock protein PspC (stress-responsive transcriptional regulator)